MDFEVIINNKNKYKSKMIKKKFDLSKKKSKQMRKGIVVTYNEKENFLNLNLNYGSLKNFQRYYQRRKCCRPYLGNVLKPAIRYCCTYPQLYKRRNFKIDNLKVSRLMNDEIFLKL
jgi:hypothetical protein